MSVSGKPLAQSVQSLLHSVKINVKKRVDKRDRIIETELYLRWLEELDFAVTGIEVQYSLFFSWILRLTDPDRP